MGNNKFVTFEDGSTVQAITVINETGGEPQLGHKGFRLTILNDGSRTSQLAFVDSNGNQYTLNKIII